MSDLLVTLKNVCLCFGIVGFTFWQWTRAHKYRFKQRSIQLAKETFKIPFFAIWLLLYTCIVFSWVFLLFNFISQREEWLLLSVIILLVNLVCNKLWTFVAADLPTMFKSTRKVVAPVLAFLILVIGLFGTAVCYLVFTAMDRAWISFALFVPYTVWLLAAIGLSVYDNGRFGLASLIETANADDDVEMNSSSSKPGVFTFRIPVPPAEKTQAKISHRLKE